MWAALVANWPGYVFVLDAENRIASLNRSMHVIDAERDLGRDLFDFVPDDARLALLESLVEARAGRAAITRQRGPLLADGTRRWYESRLIGLTGGSVLLLTDDVLDARERMATRLRLLADASREFSEATADYDRLLTVIARRMSEALGDFCAIRAIRDDGTGFEVGAVHHADPEVIAWARDLLTEGQAIGEGAMGRVAASRQAIIIPTLLAADYAATTSPRYREILERLAVGSVMVVPLLCRGTAVGAMSLLRSGTAHPYDETDLQLAQSIADHAGLAIANARSHAAERAARAEAVAANEALHQSEVAHRLLFEASPVPLVVFDTETFELLAANDAMLRQYGYDLDELLRLRVPDLRVDADEVVVRSNVAAMGGAEGRGLSRHRRKDGSHLFVEFTSRPLVLGGRSACISVLQDVSARHDAEASRALLAAIVESANDAIISKRLDGTITSWNAAAERLFGYSATEAVGQPITLIVPADGLAEERTLFERVRAGGRIDQLETVRRRKDGSDVPVAISVAPILDGAGRVVGASKTVRDLTAQRQAERALNATEQQLRQSQKMEAVGRLAGGIAHDFNNVLSVILSYGEMLLGELEPGDPKRDDVDEIQTAARRAADLTRQLLMFSRQQVVSPKVLDLNDVLARMGAMLRRILGEDIDLKFGTAPDLGQVMADPSNVEQIIMNLVVNARDAMPTGGKLTIETANAELDEHYSHAHFGAAIGPHVMLAVSDTGCGMDRATQSRIFEPFFTTKDVGRGTGLGLSTVFGIVQQSGGTVWVYSEPGAGATFKVYLPRVTAPAVVTSPEAGCNLRGTETVLLVEDQEQVRVVAARVLERSGYRVLVAERPSQALALAETHPGVIHLLLTDVVMPEMGGAELAKRIALTRPETKVLCMSGYTDDSVVRHGVLLSEMPFLQKPFTPGALRAKIRELLDAPTDNRQPS